MKSLNYWILMLLMATSCLTLASCGDDDDEQGNENTKKCYIDTDGRHVDFKYAYLSIDELANLSGRFNYEFICDIGKRVPRIYTRNHEVYLVRDCSGTN